MRRAPLHIAMPVDEEAGDFDVIESNDIAYGYLEAAQELWRLAGCEQRAEAIQDLIRAAYKRNPPRIVEDEISALRDALDGIEDALAARVTDSQHMLTMGQVAKLRGHCDVLDLDPARGEAARSAVQETIVYVDHLREIVAEALQHGAQILFD